MLVQDFRLCPTWGAEVGLVWEDWERRLMNVDLPTPVTPTTRSLGVWSPSNLRGNGEERGLDVAEEYGLEGAVVQGLDDVEERGLGIVDGRGDDAIDSCRLDDTESRREDDRAEVGDVVGVGAAVTRTSLPCAPDWDRVMSCGSCLPLTMDVDATWLSVPHPRHSKFRSGSTECRERVISLLTWDSFIAAAHGLSGALLAT